MSGQRKRYKPRGISEEAWEVVRPFTDDLLAPLYPGKRPPRDTRVVVNQVANFAWLRGIPLTTDDLFTDGVISWYLRDTDLTDATRATYRSRLVSVARAINPNAGQMLLLSYGKREPHRPYSDREAAELWAWARGQGTEHRRQSAQVLVALGLGAGLLRTDIALLRARDLRADHDGVLIDVPGSSERQVPVLARWEKPLIQALERVTDAADYLFRPACTTRGDNILTCLFEGREGVAPSVYRMRATWIVTHLRANTPIRDLMAAGAIGLDGIERLIPFVPPSEPARFRSTLRDAGQR